MLFIFNNVYCHILFVRHNDPPGELALKKYSINEYCIIIAIKLRRPVCMYTTFQSMFCVTACMETERDMSDRQR